MTKFRNNNNCILDLVKNKLKSGGQQQQKYCLLQNKKKKKTIYRLQRIFREGHWCSLYDKRILFHFFFFQIS